MREGLGYEEEADDLKINLGEHLLRAVFARPASSAWVSQGASPSSQCAPQASGLTDREWQSQGPTDRVGNIPKGRLKGVAVVGAGGSAPLFCMCRGVCCSARPAQSSAPAHPDKQEA